MSRLAQYLDPDVIRQVERLDLRARFIVEGFLAGRHRAPFQGYSLEFSEHRKYVQGDDLRSIDWSVFARTDRLFVRKHSAETHLHCHVLIDASASMGPVGELGAPLRAGSKFAYAVHLAAALGYLATKRRDAIGLGILRDGLETLLPARTRRPDFIHMLATLAATKPAGLSGVAAGMHEVVRRLRHRGVVVLLSDLLVETPELLEALHHVRFRGHDLIVMHILDGRETRFDFHGPVRLDDPETGGFLTADADGARASYAAALESWRAELRERIAALRGDYVPLDTFTPFDRALVEFLTQRSRRR